MITAIIALILSIASGFTPATQQQDSKKKSTESSETITTFGGTTTWNEHE
ncbi:hypothetical protein [Pontibacter liquoris]|nr:hypothetical protein [Pontibacter liquoris]